MSVRRLSKFPAFPASDCLEQQKEITRAINRVMTGGQFILGHEVQAFEEEFASYLGTRHCIGVGSGTDAIELMLRALDIGPGDKVIVPAYAPSAVASGVERAGASIVLVDVDARTLTLSPGALRRELESQEKRQIKAALAVHLYGQPAHWDKLQQVAAEHQIPLLEDAAQAHGATLNGRRIGSLGLMAAFSFYPTKNLGALGDAGGVTTSDAHLANRLRQLRQYGWQRRNISDQSGINSRMDELQAAVLRVKLPMLEAHVTRRRQLAGLYHQHLQGIPQIMTPSTENGCQHAYHQYIIRTPQRDQLHEHLQSREIPTSVLYPAALHQQPAWHHERTFPASEQASAEALALPLHPYLKDESTEIVADAIHQFFHATR